MHGKPFIDMTCLTRVSIRYGGFRSSVTALAPPARSLRRFPGRALGARLAPVADHLGMFTLCFGGLSTWVDV